MIGIPSHLQKGLLMRLSISTVIISLCVGLASAFAAPEPANDDQKTLYALGLAISQSLGSFMLNDSELELVKSGLTDGVLKRPPKVDLQVFGPKIQQLQASRATVLAENE